MAFVHCFVRGLHDVARHPLGGWRCRVCGKPCADFSEAGYGRDSGYVAPLRRIYDRRHGGSYVRTGWDDTHNDRRPELVLRASTTSS